MQSAAIILAAGLGSRMKSNKPKVAHEILDKPLVNWVVDAAKASGISKTICVVGHGRAQVEKLVSNTCEIAVQPKRDGTAGAVICTKEVLEGFEGSVVVLSGDSPLIRAETIQKLVCTQQSNKAAVAVLTMKPENPHGYGRIIRDSAGCVLRIVEQKDATDAEAKVTECNSGVYCFDAKALFSALEKVKSNNAQGELYLTDVLEICRHAGQKVCALLVEDATECLGVNSQIQLAQARLIMQQRINNKHMQEGVVMWKPESTWVGADVKLAAGVELLPNTFLLGNTSIGENSTIGPNTRLKNCTVGAMCKITETVAENSEVENGVSAGPFAYLRQGTKLCNNSKAGSHVEIKQSTVGEGSKVPHLSYIGNATIGSGVNIGAGSITCNYDGKNKWSTTIGDGAFIGSDTMMVAPVNIGSGAIVGASSCITEDVSPNSLAIGRAKQTEIKDWAGKKREKLNGKND